MKFTFNQKVRITKGFYIGYNGIVIRKSGPLSGDDTTIFYMVTGNDDTGVPAFEEWIIETHLEAIQ